MSAIIEQNKNGRLSDKCEIVLVFSNNPSAAGLTIARNAGIAVLSLDSRGKKREDFDSEVCELLKPYKIDFIILAGYMRIVSPPLVRAYPRRIINIHPADTALFKGIGAYEWAFESGQKKNAVTVHYVDEGVDTGEVIAKREYAIEGVSSLHELESLGLTIEHEFYGETLSSIFTSFISNGGN